MTTSVIIPSCNRQASLNRCLVALLAQTKLPDEVIVVENAPRKQYKFDKKKFARLQIRHILEKSPGKSTARNTGISQAKGEILAFLDDDCEPAPSWLKEITKPLQKKSIVAVLGASREKSTTLLMETYLFQYNKFFLQLRLDEKTGNVSCGAALNTRNCAVRKEFLQVHKIKFDERFNTYFFAEDTDFGEQIEAAQGKLFYASRALVVHNEQSDFGSLLKKKFLNGRAMWLLQAKGIFHKKDLARNKSRKVFQRISELLEGKSIWQVICILFFLNSIFWSYRLGYNLERIKHVFYRD
ncbi:MAG: glycosyltransferase [Candidatus Pacebacteria bacterium]|nr:glycosyltransferase [Candidatus Paceibacterota bacterium]PIR59982.1 MAG: hypothetical protein COU67_04335 [Candidatus Pacebacteria bacterium CG10_big_fil_rev_8_21_14_0_10_44_54]